MVDFGTLYKEHGEGSEPLPDSEYDFTISSTEAKKTQNGKDMFNCQCRVEGGPFNGRVVWHRFVVSPESSAAMEIFFRQMTALGLGKEFWLRGPSAEQVAEALKSRKFRGTTSIREYQGVESNEIKSIKPARSAGAGAGAYPPPPPGAYPPPPAPVAAAPAPVVAASPPPPPPPPSAPVQEEPAPPAPPQPAAQPDLPPPPPPSEPPF